MSRVTRRTTRHILSIFLSIVCRETTSGGHSHYTENRNSSAALVDVTIEINIIVPTIALNLIENQSSK